MTTPPENLAPPDEEEESPYARSSGPILLATVVLLCGGAIGLMVMHFRSTEQITTQGLDMEAPPPDEPPAAVPVSAGYGIAPPQPQSSLSAIHGAPQGMVVPGAPAERAPGAGRAPSREQAGTSFTDAVRKHEKTYYHMAVKYTKKYPVFKEYGREWMSYPDLNKACKGYYEHRNPIKYAYEVAASPNFPKLVSKYARRPEMQAFIKEAAMNAPGDLMKSLGDYLKADGNAMGLVKKFAASAGLPPALVAGITGGQPQRVDQQEVMNQIMNSNPELQKAMQGQPAPPQAR